MADRPWIGFVNDKGLKLDDRDGFIQWVVKRFEGEEVKVTVRKKASRQGRQSMRYYRGVVVPDIAHACGYTEPDDWPAVHESLAWKFLRLPDHPLGYPQRQSTSKDEMPQDEMTAFIDQCITWAETSIPGCRVRRPDEVDLNDVPDYWEAA